MANLRHRRPKQTAWAFLCADPTANAPPALSPSRRRAEDGEDDAAPGQKRAANNPGVEQDLRKPAKSARTNGLLSTLR